jgi:spermidine synthase
MLGHSAYAQTLVLAIFMGGMAGGAWLCSRYLRPHHPALLIYAVIEGLVGLAGIAFHSLYVSGAETLYLTLIPDLDSSLAIETIKWSLAVALILPQSLMLGATFPLMSVGLIRVAPDRSGRTLGMLYFTNSIGAALGALVSIFVLVPSVGLPGTTLTAGIINIAIAIATWVLAKPRPGVAALAREADDASPATASASGRLRWLLLVGAFSTGLASFIYEIAWIRMLTMVLGATTQAFEMMLSAFITGLALGGLWIRRHIQSARSHLRWAGHIQILMSVLAILTVPLYNYTFEFMAYLLEALDTTDSGYTLFNLASHGIALFVMLPTTFLAGMTLPLFTYALILGGGGEQSVGRIYAANTVGSITGVLLAVHVLMPLAGTSGMIAVGAVVDSLVGVVFLSMAASTLRRFERPAIAGAAGAIIAFVAVGVTLDPFRKASGVYRSGVARTAGEEMLFARDGKTATIHVYDYNESGGTRVIATNGKPEAGIRMDGPPHGTDMITMVAAAAVPLAIHPEAESVANIGMGSGITTDTLLADPSLSRVDTIEIEPAVLDAAELFRPLSARAYEDPRSHLHVADAKTFFAEQGRTYDLIVSEPSNPWVSGVASLFTQEFYSRIERYLRKDGLLVQWLQLYETNSHQVSSVLQALARHFPNYAIYNTDSSNILIVASHERDVTALAGDAFQSRELARAVERGGFESVNDVAQRFVASEPLLEAFPLVYPAPVNSDFFPYLSLHAPRSRYLQQSATQLSRVQIDPVPMADLLDSSPAYVSDAPDPAVSKPYAPSHHAAQARAITGALLREQPALGGADTGKLDGMAELIHHSLLSCDITVRNATLRKHLMQLARRTLPYGEGPERRRLWGRLRSSECLGRYDKPTRQWLAFHDAVARRSPEAMITESDGMLSSESFREAPRSRRNYVFGNRLLAQLARGDRAGARETKSLARAANNGDLSNAPFYLRWLAAIAMNRRASAEQPSR